MKKRLLILGAGVFQVPFIEKAKEMGCYVGVIDINPDSPGIALADEYFCCSLVEKDQVLRIAERFSTEGITVGTCEVGVITAAYVAQKMSLPFYCLDVAKCATNKIDMIQCFKKYGVSSPEYEVIRLGDKIATNIKYPVITKPADKSASRGIYYVENEGQLENAVLESMECSDSKEVLIQEYMDGPEISVELGVEKDNPVALQVTDKMTNGAPHYVEIGQMQPSRISDEMVIKVKKLACAAAKAIKLENCAGHAEIKLTSSGPKMVEIGGRMGGHYVDSYLLENSSGYQLQEAIIRFALGEEFILRKTDKDAEVGMMCILSEEGFVKEIKGIQEAKKIEGILKVVISAKIGKRYHKGVSNNDLIGYVVAMSTNEKSAKEICEEALKKITIMYESTDF